MTSLGSMSLRFPSKEFATTVFGRTFRDAHCEKCGHDYRYVLAGQGEGRGAVSLLSPLAEAEEIAVRESVEDLSRELKEGVRAVPCPGCGWLQADMVQLLRDDRDGWLAFVGAAAMIIAGLGLGASTILDLANGQLRNPRLSRQLSAVLGGCAAAMVGGYGLIALRRRRAGSWNPNDVDLVEQRNVGRTLAVATDASVKELIALLADADLEQRRQVQRTYADELRFKALLFACLAVLGWGLLISEARLITKAAESFAWPRVPGEIQWARVGSERRGKHHYY